MKHPILRKKQCTLSCNSGARWQEPTGTSHSRNPGRGKVHNNLPLSFEQYTALAQTALDQGDRVLAETYYQGAEHALRLTNEAKENSFTPVVDARRNLSSAMVNRPPR